MHVKSSARKVIPIRRPTFMFILKQANVIAAIATMLGIGLFIQLYSDIEG